MWNKLSKYYMYTIKKIVSIPIYKNPFSYFLTCIIATDAIYVRHKFSKRKNQSQIDIGFVLKVSEWVVGIYNTLHTHIKIGETLEIFFMFSLGTYWLKRIRHVGDLGYFI